MPSNVFLLLFIMNMLFTFIKRKIDWMLGLGEIQFIVFIY